MAENKLAMIVLAGGASSRMGQEKSDLLLNGRTFLETQIAKGRQLGVNRIYVSGYRGEGCTEEIVMDRIKERGPLGGLEACQCKRYSRPHKNASLANVPFISVFVSFLALVPF